MGVRLPKIGLEWFYGWLLRRGIWGESMGRKFRDYWRSFIDGRLGFGFNWWLCIVKSGVFYESLGRGKAAILRVFSGNRVEGWLGMKGRTGRFAFFMKRKIRRKVLCEFVMKLL